jgi:hypothetical protein
MQWTTSLCNGLPHCARASGSRADRAIVQNFQRACSNLQGAAVTRHGFCTLARVQQAASRDEQVCPGAARGLAHPLEVGGASNCGWHRSQAAPQLVHTQSGFTYSWEMNVLGAVASYCVVINVYIELTAGATTVIQVGCPTAVAAEPATSI